MKRNYLLAFAAIVLSIGTVSAADARIGGMTTNPIGAKQMPSPVVRDHRGKPTESAPPTFCRQRRYPGQISVDYFKYNPDQCRDHRS